jgi:hemoglobin
LSNANGTQQPDVPLFELLGGEDGLRKLVDSFYDHMDTDAAWAVLRALHPPQLTGSRDKLFWFLCGWTGGPDHFVERFGHPRLRARHLPFSIGVTERDQWLGCMQQALAAQNWPQTMQQRLLAAFFDTADWLRNRAEN